VNTARAELGAVRLEELRFDNRYGLLPPAFYTRLAPTPLPDPYLVAFNPAAAELIDLAREEAGRVEFAEIFCGNRLLPGFDPLAAGAVLVAAPTQPPAAPPADPPPGPSGDPLGDLTGGAQPAAPAAVPALSPVGSGLLVLLLFATAFPLRSLGSSRGR